MYMYIVVKKKPRASYKAENKSFPYPQSPSSEVNINSL